MAKIILVDDSAFLIKQIQAFLEEHGYEIIAVGKNENEAVELFKKHRPDLITLDITMPNKSGSDALKEIFEIDPNANAIMISALKDKDIIRNCLELGAKGYIEKPLKFRDEEFCEDFIDCLNEALED